jgi:hypothetical protein
MLQESEVKCGEYKNNSHIHGQPFPEKVPKE